MEVFANFLICLAGLLWGIELIPQIVKIYKSKKVNGISVLYFGTCLTAYLLYVLGNIILGNIIIVLSLIPSVIGNIWVLLLIKKYSKGKL